MRYYSHGHLNVFMIIYAFGRPVCLLAISSLQRARHSDLHVKTKSDVIVKLRLNDLPSKSLSSSSNDGSAPGTTKM